MNLIFRVLFIFIAAWFKPKIANILAPSRLSMIVLPTDLDFNMHMNNGRYFTIMDLGRLDFLLRSGFAKAVHEFKSVPILAASQIRYRFPLNPFQKYTLETQILGWDDKWLFIEQRFIRDRKIAAIALLKACFWNNQNQSTVPTYHVLSNAGWTGESPQLPVYLHDWQRAENSLREAGSTHPPLNTPPPRGE